jgi:phage repressor protein C with HTH and peptisase S24 domain
VLSHRDIWAAIDAIADRHGLTASALARQAGLDPTAFNRSKRVSRDGRERWPSTESIAKVLEATGEGFDSFIAGAAAFVSAPSRPPAGPVLPLLGMAQAGAGGFFDAAGFPAGEGWDAVQMPSGAEPGLYALEVTGDSMLPIYREGDRLVVSRGEQVRRGDRVVVMTRSGEVTAKILARQTARHVELHSANPDYPPRVFDVEEIEWMARIIWASQ